MKFHRQFYIEPIYLCNITTTFSAALDISNNLVELTDSRTYIHMMYTRIQGPAQTNQRVLYCINKVFSRKKSKYVLVNTYMCFFFFFFLHVHLVGFVKSSVGMHYKVL